MDETTKPSIGDDIAIIGVGCRFPGDAVNPTAFFDMLLAGRDAWKKTPIERFDADAFYHPHNARHGTMVVKGGYYLKEDVGAFDAPFFSMTKTEADAMDPQQRLLLEVSYECMENAGVPIEKLAGTDTACFVGGFTTDYDRMSTQDINDTLQYSATGNGLGMLSNRLSWFYNLQGPSMTVDTACSSSLVALHLACQAIRTTSRSRTALVGGVGLILSPDAMVGANPLKFFSPDSKCFSFDARANGYARGEGAAVILLKHIDDAIRDGDTIRAIIRGSGVNQDGKTPGITLPNSHAQASLIRSTYEAAGLDLTETSYFEAHGTGTPAGDPLEMEAIGSTFGSVSRNPDRPIFVGTVKPNIGHLEGCAGMAGILKATLALESGIIPPNLNFETPNPLLRLDEWNVKIPLECTPLPTTASGLRRISVNSFGYGGTNAHVILDDAFHYLSSRGISTNKTNTRSHIAKPSFNKAESVSSSEDTEDHDSVPSASTPISSAGSDNGEESHSKARPKHDKAYVLSGPDQAAVTRMMNATLELLRNRAVSTMDDEFCTDLAHTLGSRRSLFSWRSSLVASTIDELSLKLSSDPPKPIRAATSDSAQMVWVFTGQGAQWFAMGRELLNYEVFKNSVSESDSYLKSIGAPWSVLDELMASEEESKVNQASYSQPICTVLQIALVDLMHHWGLHPAAVTGHSSGEIAAAYAAGALSQHDCLKVAFTRGHCSKHLVSAAPHLKGGMTSVGLSEEAAMEYLERLPSTDIAVVACVNSPSNVTISGDTAALDKLEPMLKESSIFARRLKVDHAYHSPHMKYVSDAYFQSIQDIALREPDNGTFDRPVMFSSVTGSIVSTKDLSQPTYWVDNMTSPVQFSKTITNIFDPQSPVMDGKLNVIVEIGPHSALQGPLNQILKHNGRAEGSMYISMLHRGRSAITTALEAAGKLWCTGFGVDMSHVNSPDMATTPSGEKSPKSLPNLPSYPWNHANRYWHCSSQQRAHLFAKTPRLDWLGSRAEDFNPLNPCWKNTLRVSELPWLVDHCITENIIFPGAGMMCCALEAARQMAQPGRDIDTFEFRDLTFGTALLVPDSDRGVEIFTHLRPRKLGLKSRDAPWFEYTIYSLKDDGSHNEHSSGLIKVQYKDETVAPQDDHDAELERIACQQMYQDAMTECTETMDIADVYAQLDHVGMRFGPSFQCVKDVKMAPGKAVVTLAIPDTKSLMPGNFEHDHLLHPATLDGCLHGLIAATASERKGFKHLAIVTEIGYASISAEIPRGSGSILCGIVQAKRTGFRDMVTTAHYCTSSMDKPVLYLADVRGTDLAGMIGDVGSSEDMSSVRKICSEMVYRDDVDLIRQKDAQQIFQQTIEAPDELSDFIHLAQQATGIYVDRALKATTEAVEASLPPHLILYVQWLRKTQRLASDAGLRGLKSLAEPARTDDAANDFLAKFENICEDSKLLCAVGKNLPEILAGNVAPLDVMMQNDMLTKTYAQAHGVISGVHMIKDWFDLRGHKQPSMRILEIGAGTGSITLPILQILKPQPDSTARFDSYVFTDISPGFFEPARSLLQDWQDLIDFQKLDIEKCPIEQGFQPASFDVIAASNVLHATKDIATTLKNCHTLLKPGGKLVLGEITQPIEYLSLIYGTLPGWWRFEDSREGGPCLSQEDWAKHLVDAGFCAPGIDIAVKDTAVEENHIISMMVATKTAPRSHEFQNISIITSSDSPSNVHGLSNALASQLTNLGLTAATVDLDAATSLQEDGTAQSADKFAIVLLEAETPLISNLQESEFYKIRNLLSKSRGILWVTCGSKGAGAGEPHLRAVSGLFRVLKAENTQLQLHELHLSRPDGPSPDLKSLVDSIVLTYESISLDISIERETEIVEEDGRLKIPRVVDERNKNWDIHVSDTVLPPKLQPLVQPDRPLALAAGVPGKLETLFFVDDVSLSDPLPDNEVEIEVQANSLNYKDVMVAMGHVMDRVIGSDATGIVRKVGKEVSRLQVGDRVAVLTRGAMRTTIRVDGRLPQKIPEDMSMAHAATLPTVFVTAYQVLIETARIQRGESILIHCAAGGLGQALIQIAQSLEADIYVTVGSTAKRQLLTERYGIPPTHIFNSRDLSFAKGIMRVTEGRGVDVVVNSLHGEALRHTLGCVADFGRFVEVGMRDIIANSGLDMEHFSKNTTFSSVNVDHMCRTSVPRIAYLMEKVFGLLQKSTIKAVSPVTVYDYTDFITGFRAMNDGTHIGKIAFEVTPKSVVSVAIPKSPDVLNLDPKGTYVIVGGLGGLGRGMASYLAERGANYLVFLSRSGAATEESQKLLERLSSSGVTAVAYACDIADAEKLTAVLSDINQNMPPIKGVIQSAMVLRDSMFENMTWESWMAATRPKIQGTWNLHQLMPKELDFFVMLSSSTAIIGNRGQANYCAGNTFQDALAYHRKSLGLPAVSLDLGAIRGIGWVAENSDTNILKAMDRIIVEQKHFYSVLRSAITGYTYGDKKTPTQLITAAGSGGESIAIRQKGGSYDLWWLQEVKFAYLRKLDTAGKKEVSEKADVNVKAMLSAATSMKEAVEVIKTVTVQRLARSMMISEEDIDVSKPVHSYGVDSLVAMDFRNWIFRELNSSVTVFDILDSVPLTHLARQIGKNSELVPESFKNESSG